MRVASFFVVRYALGQALKLGSIIDTNSNLIVV